MGLMPLDFCIRQLASRAVECTQKSVTPRWDGIGPGNRRGHQLQIKKWINKQIYDSNLDQTRGNWNWKRNLKIEIRCSM